MNRKRYREYLEPNSSLEEVPRNTLKVCTYVKK